VPKNRLRHQPIDLRSCSADDVRKGRRDEPARAFRDDAQIEKHPFGRVTGDGFFKPSNGHGSRGRRIGVHRRGWKDRVFAFGKERGVFCAVGDGARDGLGALRRGIEPENQSSCFECHGRITASASGRYHRVG